MSKIALLIIPGSSKATSRRRLVSRASKLAGHGVYTCDCEHKTGNSMQWFQSYNDCKFHLALEVAPHAKVQRVEVGAAGWPIHAANCPSADHPPIELPVQVPHVGISDMHGGAILLPPKPVEVSTIPNTQARQHMVLEEAVVPLAVQVLVAEDKEAKCPITVHSKKDHKLLVKGGFLHTEVIRPSTLRIIGFERSIPGRYFVIIWQQNWRRSVLTTNTCAHSGCSQGHSAESRPHLRPEALAVPGQSWLKATGRMQGGAAGLEAGAGAGG